ncbi:MAG: hypothetical protein AAF533_02490 [Acidobacteriota bacterium]
MEFQLSPEEAEVLRHLAQVEPREARAYLQDHPELAQRMTNWPPELRLEICRILYQSFDEETLAEHRKRHPRGSSDLVDQLQGLGDA